MACRLAGLVLPKEEHCTRKMPPSKTVCYSRKRPVPCIPKCHRRYYFTILIFKHFFDELRKYVFGQELPNKPRTYKVTTCLTAALLGWLQICDKVLRVWHLQRPWICVSWSRRHYNKLTLPFFSDTEYQSVFTRLLVKTVGVWLCLQKKSGTISLLYKKHNWTWWCQVTVSNCQT